MQRRTFIKTMAGAAAAVYAIGADLAKGKDRSAGLGPDGRVYTATRDLVRVMHREHTLANVPASMSIVLWMHHWEWRLNPLDFAELVKQIETFDGPLKPYSEVRFRGVIVISDPLTHGRPFLTKDGLPWRIHAQEQAARGRWRNFSQSYTGFNPSAIMEKARSM